MKKVVEIVQLWDGEKQHRVDNEWWLILLMTCLAMCIAFNVTVISVRYWCSRKRDKAMCTDILDIVEEKWHLEDEMNALIALNKSVHQSIPQGMTPISS
ncbi:hypothetical protein QR680_014334 [Steinernema hermaphroditum]|uniref:Uncharacterized protein n=1 Tax=Steinernema hermaphroditum TaxID=289476 RepID=A0AA39I8K9_9BILA|nr:hypothetical protein QR680_014334 [Steinernema hermaphroditum]